MFLWDEKAGKVLRRGGVGRADDLSRGKLLVRMQAQSLSPMRDWRADCGVGGGTAVLWVPVSFGARRFPKGERKALWCARRRMSLAPEGNDAPTTAREHGLLSHGFPPASVPEGFQRASGKPFGAPAGAYPLSPDGD